MKVILTETVKKLGSVGDIVNVSAGFARNFIIPNKCGVLADEGNAKNLTDKRKMLAKKVDEEKSRAETIKKSIEGTTITLTKKVGGNGRLFGTVTNNDIAVALEENGFDVEKRMVNIEVPIKTLGTFEVKAQIFQDVEATFNVTVEMSAKQAEELEQRAKLKEEAKAHQEARAAQAKAEESTKSDGENADDSSKTESVEATETTES